jgi:uncharacterized membrane protein
MKYFLAYGIATVTFFALDMVWLGLVTRSYYRSQMGSLMADSVNWLPAIAFYLLFVAALVNFVIGPALDGGGLGRMILNAALFGLVTYATYDLTGWAVIRNWPVALTFVDLAWGTVLSTMVSLASYHLTRTFWQ